MHKTRLEDQKPLPAEMLKDIQDAHEIEKGRPTFEQQVKAYAVRYLKSHPKTKPAKLARIVARVYNIKLK